MKESKKVSLNYLFNTSYQLLALIVPLITTPYISRVLKADGIGVYSYTYSIVCYFTLCAILGTATFANKQIGVLQDNPIERTKKFWDIFSLRTLTSILALIFYAVYVVFGAQNKTIAWLQSFYILGVLFDVSWFFQGMEDYRRIAIRNYIFKIINVISIFVFIHEPSDLWKYVFSLAFLTWLGNLSVWPFLRKYLVKISYYKPKPFADIKVILQLFVPTVALQVYAILDKTMLGQITLDAAQNGYYEQAEKIVKMCLMLVTALSTVLLPKVSKAYAEQRPEEAKDYLYKAYKFVWFLGTPLMCGTAVVAPILVPVFFGEGFSPVVRILQVMSLLFAVMGFNYTSGTLFFIAAGKEKDYTKRVIVGGLVNFCFNIIIIQKCGALGAAVSSVLGELVIMLMEFQYMHKHKTISVEYVFLLGRKYLFAGIIMVIVIKYFSGRICVSAISLSILIIIGVIVYFLMLLLEREDFTKVGIITIANGVKKLLKR